MISTKKFLLAGASLFFLMSPAGAIAADTNIDTEIQRKLNYLLKTEDDVKSASVKIEVTPNAPSDTNHIDFSEFDINKDGVFEKEEVGEKLFSVFDRDKNGVIDNREMKKVGLRVYTPMKKKIIETVEYNDEGKEQKTTMTEEDFIKESQLIKFDKNGDGLSPLDFLDMPFNHVNVNRRDSVIDLYEWKRAYAKTVKPLHMESFHYNN